VREGLGVGLSLVFFTLHAAEVVSLIHEAALGIEKPGTVLPVSWCLSLRQFREVDLEVFVEVLRLAIPEGNCLFRVHRAIVEAPKVG